MGLVALTWTRCPSRSWSASGESPGLAEALTQPARAGPSRCPGAGVLEGALPAAEGVLLLGSLSLQGGEQVLAPQGLGGLIFTLWPT